MMMTTLFTFFLCLFLFSRAHCMPLFLVQSGRGKCFTAIVPEGTTIQVDYEAPDLVLKSEDPSAGPAWITIHSRSGSLDAIGLDYNLHSVAARKRDNRKLRPTSEELKSRKGSVFHTVELNGEVDICIRASSASSKNPMRFGILVNKKPDETELESDNQDPADHHWTHMEREMRHLTVQMKSILGEADFSKEREMSFHSQSEKMHAATTWWPIMHLSIMLMTGFTQAGHIVRFFKTRRII